MSENEKLAQEVKAWRAKEGLTAEAAAKAFGIPKRTFEGIEQGRGFPYPLLLRVAMKSNALSLKAMQEKSSLND
ncbi:helix-turn-helix transcriptional regulator [Mesorhizobium sp. VK25A]|uniref:Helix-turn-helix transcriptional regulator n=3 Tax=Mesorhizobium TaxID=68287 RepID=A0ABU5AF96_9HYPH|nr:MULTISPECIES: helix-turn-helix transcriptional regulator [unclassified Mesorhizobium]MDX8447689.1 helix-turn-helix transcriptional regulator [Mesorhizobium sp. VK3C]MDX8469379.1 helix-turn-helix transcriptional regulator [Mesorhizobium sp. VK23B]MDX8475717.1 helix-turn-helix transcriptional regulator [Mesorhizobium sp. VK23A]MDX8500226.1 helix-turn-helix transcriptional regulator [Mesorhizobium sp. VK4C]MDX8509001.1 helix-turn-helix transcriptional regulator [Mesorhizobium sp. VK22E]